MKLSVKLDQSEIRDAIKAYVENKTSMTVAQNGVSLSFAKAQDQRETDQLSATVTCEGN
jgi:hypothetical protein